MNTPKLHTFEDHLAAIVALVAIIVGAAFLGTAAAKADPNPVYDYAVAHSDAVCTVLDEYPSFDGIVGIGLGIHDAGYTFEQAGQIIRYAVDTRCPEHTGLLGAFIRANTPRGHLS